MLENIFLLLKKERINLDRKEFEFQVKTHPSYPSLLSFVDALNFFKVKNYVLKVNFNEIENLPKKIICLLNNDFYFVEKKQNTYFIFDNQKEKIIHKEELFEKWGEIVLFLEKSELNKSYSNSYKYINILFSFVFIFFLVINSNVGRKIEFLILPIIGLFLSYQSLKNIFGFNENFISKLCNASKLTSCESVINSNQWKILEKVKLNEISIIFFSFQFFSFFIENEIQYFYFQKIILLLSIPIIFISIYYQKFIEKKWCLVCLGISLVLISEIIFLQLNTIVSILDFKIFCSSFLLSILIYFFWQYLKSKLVYFKKLKDFEIKGTRFIKNYSLFKFKLLSSEKIITPKCSIVLGSQNKSKIEITIITNPFCGYCKEVHKLIKDIYFNNLDKIKVNVLFNIDFSNLDEKSIKLSKSLYQIYFEKGENDFLFALEEWYNKGKIDDWLNIYNLNISNTDDDFFKKINDWSRHNYLTFTPIILINGFQYPKIYEIENLEFFMNEVIEDSDFI
jgi:uncharacterized membrane protein